MVNCKFIKRDARRDSDSYGKCGINRTLRNDDNLVLLLLLLRQSIQAETAALLC